MGRFNEFIYTIPKRYSEWGDAYASPRAYFMGNESLWNSRLRMGFSVVLKETLAEHPHFHHSIEEYYLFSGSDLTNFFDFDAEIDIWIGEDPDEMEKYTITRPGIVRIPPGMWHGPIHYRRVGKPVAFSSVYFDGEQAKITRRINEDGTVEYPSVGTSLKRCTFDRTRTCDYCGKCIREYTEKGDSIEPNHHPSLDFAYVWAKELVNSEPIPHTGKYDKYFFDYPVEYHQYGDTYANPRGKFRGITQMPEAGFYGGFSVVMKETDMEVPHIHFSNDEYLWFIGADLEKVFDFDAEIEIKLGWNPDDMETIVITRPTIIRVPPNMWHCPIKFKRITKPVAFFPVYSDGDWSKVVRQKNDNGDDEYLFEAASLRKCTYDHGKICNYCGKCAGDSDVEPFGVFTYKKKGDAKV